MVRMLEFTIQCKLAASIRGSTMTLKERVENNVVVFLLGSLVTGFVAGFGAHQVIMGMAGLAETNATDWKEAAKDAGWIPREECPAFPINLRIASPGDVAVVPYSSAGTPALRTDLVIHSSRPIPLPTSVGTYLQ
jgi:hypothetical protein